MAKRNQRAVFGDFQTPLELARHVIAFIESEEKDIRTVVEPTCGRGSFLRATAELLGAAPSYFGFDINAKYVSDAKEELCKAVPSAEAKIEERDFYEMDWKSFFTHQSTPILVIGNPPWITNAAMGSMNGKNLPKKNNFQRHNGFAAKTGKANFDISEWMLIRLLEALQGLQGALAVLCKTATARKVLRHAWLNGLSLGPSSLHLIDATLHFGVSVDACLFYTHTGLTAAESTATVYADLSFTHPQNTLGLLGGELVSDIHTYRKWRVLDGLEYRKWRSGVKHDAAKIMEFRSDGAELVNGLGEQYDLESDFVYPLLKSSDLANGRLEPSRSVLLTQQRVTDATEAIQSKAPRTWKYLMDHADQLDKRGSSIYAKRARFSVFGIGDYTFAPWKVAISGMYKNLRFQAIGKQHGKPIVVDDTCYFIPCKSKTEAEFFADLLNSNVAQRFIRALVFSDAKRPITIDVLKRIDLKKLAESVDQDKKAVRYLASPALESSHQRMLVFDKHDKYKAGVR